MTFFNGSCFLRVYSEDAWNFPFTIMIVLQVSRVSSFYKCFMWYVSRHKIKVLEQSRQPHHVLIICKSNSDVDTHIRNPVRYSPISRPGSISGQIILFENTSWLALQLLREQDEVDAETCFEINDDQSQLEEILVRCAWRSFDLAI